MAYTKNRFLYAMYTLGGWIWQFKTWLYLFHDRSRHHMHETRTRSLQTLVQSSGKFNGTICLPWRKPVGRVIRGRHRSFFTSGTPLSSSLRLYYAILQVIQRPLKPLRFTGLLTSNGEHFARLLKIPRRPR